MAEELTQLVTLMGGEVVEDPWDLASHAAQYKLVLRCVDSDAHPPTPAEVELFNGQLDGGVIIWEKCYSLDDSEVKGRGKVVDDSEVKGRGNVVDD